MEKVYFVYIMASRPHGTVYVGVANDLIKRIYEHKNKIGSAFVRAYNIFNLVYYEDHRNIHEAIAREKKIKKWRRDWKDELIEKTNPNWEDLYPVITGEIIQ